MTDAPFNLTRRRLLASLAATGLAATAPAAAFAQVRRQLDLTAGIGALALRPGEPDTALAALMTAAGDGPLRFRRGDELAISLANTLPSPALLNIRGAGTTAAEPLLARQPAAPGGRESFSLPLRHAGTSLCDLRLLGDDSGPMPVRALLVAESEAVAVDRDEVLLVEDIRLDGNGRALAPGRDAKASTSLFILNRKVGPALAVRSGQRLRLRFINGCHRTVIALKIADHELRVMAVDGQPAEPFVARAGQVVLAPGSRVDAVLDALRPPGSESAILLHDGDSARTLGRLSYSDEPALRAAAAAPLAALPSNGLPERLDLKSALRVDLPLAGAQWSKPAELTARTAPAFRLKPGRVAVLALSNPSNTPVVFHLHGHWFRLLDRLDDGWKPFWLDTLTIGAQQTERIAFAAEQPGRWLLEAMAAQWSAPRLLRAYAVE
jgi:FtsP/CotA-like multicopper oxidase with cupredoxin domain